MKTKITREIEAEQWLGEGRPLPDGAHLCRPEVNWSAGRAFVYFTYAELKCAHWIGTEELAEVPKAVELGGGISVTRKDGSAYHRQVLPFAFYSVKSEASATRDYHAVYLDKADAALVRMFVDYVFLEKWGNPLPPRAEFRVADGGCKRGFRTFYLAPGDWILREHDDAGRLTPRVVSDAAFRAMAA